MKIVEMYGTVQVLVPMSANGETDLELFKKARAAFERAVTNNGTPIHVEVESLDLSEVKTTNEPSCDQLEIVRLLLGEWQLLKPDAEYHGFGVELAVRNVMRRFGWVTLTRQAYLKLASGITVADNSRLIDEEFFGEVLTWDGDGNIYDALTTVLYRYDWTAIPHDEWWSYVDDEPASQVEDSRQAAELPAVR